MRPMTQLRRSGGVLGAPIFTEFMKVALKDAPPKEFQVPPGIEMIPIDRRTGLRAQAGDDGVILEAFEAGRGPPDLPWFSDFGGLISAIAPGHQRAYVTDQGGAYSQDAYPAPDRSIAPIPSSRSI